MQVFGAGSYGDVAQCQTKERKGTAAVKISKIQKIFLKNTKHEPSYYLF